MFLIWSRIDVILSSVEGIFGKNIGNISDFFITEQQSKALQMMETIRPGKVWAGTGVETPSTWFVRKIHTFFSNKIATSHPTAWEKNKWRVVQASSARVVVKSVPQVWSSAWLREGDGEGWTVDEGQFTMVGFRPGPRTTLKKPIPNLFPWQHSAGGACSTV